MTDDGPHMKNLNKLFLCSYSVAVITEDFESSNVSSNLTGSFFNTQKNTPIKQVHVRSLLILLPLEL